MGAVEVDVASGGGAGAAGVDVGVVQLSRLIFFERPFEFVTEQEVADETGCGLGRGRRGQSDKDEGQEDKEPPVRGVAFERRCRPVEVEDASPRSRRPEAGADGFLTNTSPCPVSPSARRFP